MDWPCGGQTGCPQSVNSAIPILSAPNRTRAEAGFQTASDLARAITEQTWPDTSNVRVKPFVVCTGGEPLLQLDAALVNAIHFHESFQIAIETNGTLTPPPGIDWICVSPKAAAEIVLKRGIGGANFSFAVSFPLKREKGSF